MAKIKDAYKILEEFAPLSLKLDYDNAGFLVGFAEDELTKILVSLDITDDVISEAVREKANLIVSHHPLFFSLKSVNDTDSTGSKIIRLIENRISAVCMHTNLDAAAGGVNDALAAAAGIKNPKLLAVDGYGADGDAYGIGRFGTLNEPMDFADYLDYVKNALHTKGLRYYDAGRKALKVAVIGGSGGSELHRAAERGCDTFITADIKYNVFLEAKERGINIIDADHFCTENVVVPILKNKLVEAFPDVPVLVSARHGQTVSFK